jgi:hypothetical protein
MERAAQPQVDYFHLLENESFIAALAEKVAVYQSEHEEG